MESVLFTVNFTVTNKEFLEFLILLFSAVAGFFWTRYFILIS